MGANNVLSSTTDIFNNFLRGYRNHTNAYIATLLLEAISGAKASSTLHHIVSNHVQVEDAKMDKVLPSVTSNHNSVHNLDVERATTIKASRFPRHKQLKRKNPQEKKKKNMQKLMFSHVEIRHYPTVIGDHPYCRVGCPISFGWDYTKTAKNNDKQQPELFSVDEYEASRSPQRYRSREELRISREERRHLLLTRYTDQELRHAERKHQRSLLYSGKNMQSQRKNLNAFFQETEVHQNKICCSEQ